MIRSAIAMALGAMFAIAIAIGTIVVEIAFGTAGMPLSIVLGSVGTIFLSTTLAAIGMWRIANAARNTIARASGRIAAVGFALLLPFSEFYIFEEHGLLVAMQAVRVVQVANIIIFIIVSLSGITFVCAMAWIAFSEQRRLQAAVLVLIAIGLAVTASTIGLRGSLSQGIVGATATAGSAGIAAALLGVLCYACLCAVVARLPSDSLLALRCGFCGYDLTGNISNVCPECGRNIPQ